MLRRAFFRRGRSVSNACVQRAGPQAAERGQQTDWGKGAVICVRDASHNIVACSYAYGLQHPWSARR